MNERKLEAKLARRAGKANRKRAKLSDGRLGRSARVRPDITGGKTPPRGRGVRKRR